MLTTILGDKEYYELHFTDEETKPQRAKVNCPISKWQSSSILTSKSLVLKPLLWKYESYEGMGLLDFSIFVWEIFQCLYN